MGWERRGTGDVAYFYLSSRDDSGRPTKVCVGKGAAGEAAARAIDQRRAQREADRRAIREAETALAAVDRLMDDLGEAAAVLVEAVLLGEGFHRRNYGRWRRRRNGHGRCRAAGPGGAG
jgi:hypothetical protein